MRAGSLKHKISIEIYTSSTNEFNEETKQWEFYRSVYASITPLSAKEYFKAGVHSEATHKVEIRYISEITSKMRIIYDNRIFNIESVLNIREENKTLQLICTEVV